MSGSGRAGFIGYSARRHAVLFAKSDAGAIALGNRRPRSRPIVASIDGTLGPDCLPTITLDAFLATTRRPKSRPWPVHPEHDLLGHSGRKAVQRGGLMEAEPSTATSASNRQPDQGRWSSTASARRPRHQCAQRWRYVHASQEEASLERGRTRRALVGCLVEQGRVFLLHALLCTTAAQGRRLSPDGYEAARAPAPSRHPGRRIRNVARADDESGRRVKPRG